MSDLYENAHELALVYAKEKLRIALNTNMFENTSNNQPETEQKYLYDEYLKARDFYRELLQEELEGFLRF